MTSRGETTPREMSAEQPHLRYACPRAMCRSAATRGLTPEPVAQLEKAPARFGVVVR